MLRAKLESIRLIRQSGLFDAAFNAPSGAGLSFMPSLPPELAYLGDVGAWKRSTSALFDGGYYLANNADVRNSGMNPLAHYISHGYVEGRSPSTLVDINHIARQLAPPGIDVEGDEFEEHKRKMLGKFSGLRELLIKTDANPHLLFDNGYYRKVNAPHVAEAEPILLEHYIRKAGRTDDGAFLECTPYADLNYYMDRYSDLSQALVIPLMHLVKYGLKEGRTFNDLESVSQAFLDNTAALTGDPAIGKLSEFIRSCGVSGRLAVGHE